MAAAALSRSRGVAGVRTTKGLFFIFTLLSLVFLANSLKIRFEEVEDLKKKIQRVEQELDFEKAERDFTSEIMDYYANLMDPLTALMRKASKGLPEDFPPLEGLMQSLRGFMVKTKTYIDGQHEELEEEIQKKEQKLREAKELIKMFEEQKDEL